jgi:hypothetical protein
LGKREVFEEAGLDFFVSRTGQAGPQEAFFAASDAEMTPFDWENHEVYGFLHFFGEIVHSNHF